MVFGSFFIAVLLAPAYGGALADPGGLDRVVEGFYGNVICFSVALLMWAGGWGMARKHQET